MAALVHPSAVVDPQARLAADVTVGAYSIIGADVEKAGPVSYSDKARLLAGDALAAALVAADRFH